MLPLLGKMRDVADVIPCPILKNVLMDLLSAGEVFGDGERIPDGARVGATAADVIDPRDARGVDEFLNETGDIV